MAQDEYTAAELLQPAAAVPGVMTGNISAPGLAGAVSGIVSGIRHGDIKLDVPDIQAWLATFDELITIVAAQRDQLRRDAYWAASDQSLGNFPLADQIRAKLADRMGDAPGGFARAMDEVVQALRAIHRALQSSLVTHAESDEASAELLKRLVAGASADAGAPSG